MAKRDIQKTFFDIIEEEGRIFKNKEVFSLEYIPEEYEFRTGQLEAMSFYSRKLRKDKQPNNMLLKGDNATGKTTTVKKYFSLVNEYFDSVITVHINCQIYRTEYEIFSRIYKKLFKKSIATLTSVDFHDEIMNYLIDKNKILIVALDDYEVIKNSVELNRTLYSLLRAHESYPGVKITVIIITSKKENVLINLNVSTLLLPIEIHFPLYTKDQIYKILKQRVELGFYPDVVRDTTFYKIVNQCYKLKNIRFGIKELEKLGEKAEFKGKCKI